jgi:hypothetical protein
MSPLPTEGSPQRAINWVVLRVFDQLAIEYPHLGIGDLIPRLDDARDLAAAALPDLAEYRMALLAESRKLLDLLPGPIIPA